MSNMPHKPLVNSPTLFVGTQNSGARLKRRLYHHKNPLGVRIALPETRAITPVTWAYAPEWLTISQVTELSSHDQKTLGWLIRDSAVEAKRQSKKWLIEKMSLREFQEALALVLHWRD